MRAALAAIAASRNRANAPYAFSGNESQPLQNKTCFHHGGGGSGRRPAPPTGPASGWRRGTDRAAGTVSRCGKQRSPGRIGRPGTRRFPGCNRPARCDTHRPAAIPAGPPTRGSPPGSWRRRRPPRPQKGALARSRFERRGVAGGEKNEGQNRALDSRVRHMQTSPGSHRNSGEFRHQSCAKQATHPLLSSLQRTGQARDKQDRRVDHRRGFGRFPRTVFGRFDRFEQRTTPARSSTETAVAARIESTSDAVAPSATRFCMSAMYPTRAAADRSQGLFRPAVGDRLPRLGQLAVRRAAGLLPVLPADVAGFAAIPLTTANRQPERRTTSGGRLGELRPR